MNNHLLDTRFLAMPPDLPESKDEAFQIIWYSRFDEYTLVNWQHGTAGSQPLLVHKGTTADYSYNDGESLYEGFELIAWSWFELNLGEPTDEKAKIAHLSPDPRAKIDKDMGAYGLSPAIAAQLRSAEKRISFRFKE